MRSSKKHFPESRKPLGKIGEDFGGDLALVSPRTKDARHQDPSWSIRAQWRFKDSGANVAAAQAEEATIVLVFENLESEPLF